MKKIKLLIILFVCLFAVNVKADMGPPTVAEHEVMVTNKSGAQCYDDESKKTDVVLPYGKIVKVFEDISGNYIRIFDDEIENCKVKYSDVSAKTQDFKLTGENVTKIDTVKAVVFAKGGLNMRKGPSVTYSKKTTVPQYAVVTLTHKSGTFWYYATYNGVSGWITSMNGYLGIDGKNILINPSDVNIYDSVGKMVKGEGKPIGKIPANTEITNYVSIANDYESFGGYYVVYNSVKGYISNMYYKLESPGTFTLLKDYDIYDQKADKDKKLTANQDLEYTMIYNFRDNSSGLYVPSKNGIVYPTDAKIKYIKQAKEAIKESGYIGEGLFGEKKEEKTDPKTPTNTNEPEVEPVIEENKGLSTRDMVIIGLLGGIFLALTALVIIKLVNGKKKITKEEEPVINRVSEEEIEKARAIVAKELEKEEEENSDKEV